MGPRMQEEQDTQEEFQQKPSTAWRVVRGVVALVVMAGLVYISGVHQYFFFSRTSPNITQEQTQSAIDAERVTVPVVVFIVQNNQALGSKRSRENAQRMVEQADRIWQQANIGLEIQEIHTVQKTDEEISMLYRNARSFAQQIEHFEAGAINVVLVQKLQGLNGVAFGGIPLVAVADYTAGYDFRVLAHELGHKLGLGHTTDEKRLMHQGANSFELSIPEITTAREFAKKFQEDI